ncbi:hypothetical protein [Bradyrhizobium genosp. A]|uniref:hypothetical protein n=1 Tax=Bradyrhizobium genosp. A TaxID=83626 RepID=UPI003CEDC62C
MPAPPLCYGPIVLKKRKPTAKKRGRPLGVKPYPEDFEILWQVYIWMTWPQYRTKSFDELVHWAEMIRPSQRAGDRTTLPNRLKRLHAAVAASPTKYGFPKWVSRLSIKGRRAKKPKVSGAQGAAIREGARALADEADRLAREFISQTRSPEG